ncbi:GNAT family N-acetyltransferase [Actinacidiphila yeochonensis]|uniref:GNAT family N-acetyltransferase n=1 Tax=Actinacidiphila yeochonensis TaxID=89050 RepID=UPI000690BC27|nr:GNAT family N-acetyltransferase [Actinacidiphila yeochonensis]
MTDDLHLVRHGLTPAEIDETVALYAGNPEYCRAAGEYDPDAIPVERVAADLREEAAMEGGEVLLARDGSGRAVGVLCLLRRHPVDGHPWIGLLLVDGRLHRRGVGRAIVALAEERFRDHPAGGLRLAVLESNPAALAFWTSLGWHEIDRRPDLRHGRPTVVLHKPLR